MADVDTKRVEVELTSIERQEREDERRAAARDAAQTEAIVRVLTRQKPRLTAVVPRPRDGLD